MNSEALVKRTTKIMYGDEGVSGTAQYISQLVWILFLKVFDYKEEEWELEDNYVPVIPAPFRFRDWADPKDAEGNKDYKNRLTGDKLVDFVNIKLFPFLRGNEVEVDGKKYIFSSDDPKALIVREFMGESSNYMKDGVNLRQVVDEIAEIDFDNVGEKHEFNEFYEKLLKELQNGGKATGEFYTPRAVTKFITDHVDPKIGERVADFACGTAGFLAEAVSHMQKQVTKIEDNDTIQKSVYGIEWKQLPYMLATTNMLLHNVDNPNIVHGDGLAKNVLDLSEDDMYDCVLMNPPFGGVVKESSKTNFPNDLVSSESADLFIVRIMYCLKKNGRCGLVLPDGLLFSDDNSKTAIKRKLLTEFNLHTIIRLPSSIFAPYTSITTNLLFFDKTGKTKEVWFYRMDMPEGRKHFNKTHPVQRTDFDIIDEWWSNRVEIKDEKEDESMLETWKSKKYTFEELEELGFNLDLCGYPKKQEIILSPEETIANYMEEKRALEVRLSFATNALKDYLDGKSDVKLSNIKSVSEQISRLDKEFPLQMKKAVLQYAMQGKLTKQLESDSSVEAMLLEYYPDITTDYTEEFLPEVPDNWKFVKLGDVLEIARGGSPRPIKEFLTTKDDGINWIKIGDTDIGGKYINSCKEKIKPEGMRHSRFVKKGDFLLTNSMSFGRPYILNIEGCIHDGWLVFHDEHNIFDKDYLYYLLSSYLVFQQFLGKVSGGVVKNLNIDKVCNTIVPIPPFEEQQRIVEKLEKILPQLEDLKE